MTLGKWIAAIVVQIIIMIMIFASALDTYGPRTVAYLNEIGFTDCQHISCKSGSVEIRKFATDGSLIVPFNAGILLEGCNKKQYLATFAMGSVSEAWNVCCSLGMEPAVIRSLDEMKCLQNLYKNHTSYTQHDLFRVSYVDFSMTRKFVACPNSSQEVPPDTWARWSPAEPDNYKMQEACTAFQFEPILGHYDVPCFRPFKILCKYDIAENEQEIDETITTQTATTETAAITTTMKPTLNISHIPYSAAFVQQQRKSNCKIRAGCSSKTVFNGTFRALKYMGTVTSKCGNKQYFISSEQTSMATGENLWSKCCAIGGVPAMFATTAEFECFVGLFSMLPWKVIKDIDYFVDGYDMNLTRQFVTCPNHRPILDELWLGPNKFGVNFIPEVFEPDNRGGGERCVALYIRPGKFLGLADKYCTSSFKYICQVTD